MRDLALGVALVAALMIIVIGILYLATPRSAARSFGLPLPEPGPHIPWWLRLKGVRDCASGLAVLALLAAAPSTQLGLVLLIFALIPIGDMTVILAARGSRAHAFGMHGATALLMLAAAVPLALGRI
ncbi:DUF4267 domain-containing protein [Sphingomonas morindae]|uniref:DUF4267 domain-containing protein n=1 Tax=Sphingomonas morindae TaxID=1541170 RepID=A0ABY4XDI7_9SPHN|nr:DUF4267 domain-containing protein [Sphingomonas morindae]USI74967.1 DUF4267 domain-containing protein [Sphingomonas morindae]